MLGWDIGAAIGNTLGEMISRFQDVIAFEPNKSHYNYLKDVGSISHLKIYNLAISDTNGKVELPSVGKVPCRSIDSLINKLQIPDFIKVDVEGHEYRVLNGARFLMTVSPPRWLIEVYDEQIGVECQKLLYYFGYKMETLKAPGLSNNYWIRAYLSDI